MIRVTPEGDGVEIDTRKLHHASQRSASFESAPIQDRVIIAFKSLGLRIDNWSELAEELELIEAPMIDQLLIAAWQKWREGMADRLRGSFAFLLIERDSGVIFLARDIFGLAPLSYCLEAHRLIAAASSLGVRRISGRHHQPDEVMLADFLSGAIRETERTFFSDVTRLPPAHWIRIQNGAITRQRYWSAQNVARKVESPDAPKEFRSLFDRSVRQQGFDERSVLLLSGGLDSSAIAGSLCKADYPVCPLEAISMTYPDTPGWSDGQHLEALCSTLRINLQECPSDAHSPLSDMEKWLTVMDGPYLPPGHSVSSRLLDQAFDRGFTKVFMGNGGDEIVSYGFGRLNELAQARHWFELWRECRAASSLFAQSRAQIFRKYLRHSHKFRKFESWLGRYAKSTQGLEAAILSPRLAGQVDGARYTTRRANQDPCHDERMIHEEALGSPILPLSLEVYALCGQAAGVRVMMPFYDRDLAEFSLSLPSIWKLRDGLSRYVLRESMKGDLPDSMLYRQDKFDFSGNFVRGLLADRDKVLRLTDPAGAPLADYVDFDALLVAREILVRNGCELDYPSALKLWRAAILRMWLEIAERPLDRPSLIQMEIH